MTIDQPETCEPDRSATARRRWRLPARLAVAGTALALVAAACSSTSTSGAPATTTGNGAGTTIATVPEGPNIGGQVGGVSSPDAFTALTLTPVNSGTFPFLGTDGKYHVAYDLQLTNASKVPGSLEKIEVVDGADPTKVIASFSGTQLVSDTNANGDANRLRTLPAGMATSADIPPQESRAVFIDFTFDSLDDAPKVVLHHLYGTGSAAPPAQEASPIDYLTTPFDIDAGTPRVIAPPLRGENWIALNGCCEPGYGFPHRTSLNSVNGKLNNSQRYAIDWKRVNDQGEFYSGDKTKNESYVDYGADVYAVADGTVIGVLDDIEANAPGILPAQDPVMAAKLTVENVDGNHVILDLGGGVYAMYAHFIKGSITVKVGDKVKTGDKIAQLGNTGNANASHLHFQLMDGPTLLGSNGLPYVFDSFVYDGQVAPAAIIDADDYLTGTFLQGELAQGEPRTNQLPLLLAIVDFPAS
jgi:hypothetical protein